MPRCFRWPDRRLTDNVVPVRYVPIAQMRWIDPAKLLVIHVSAGGDYDALRARPCGWARAAGETLLSLLTGLAARAQTRWAS